MSTQLSTMPEISGALVTIIHGQPVTTLLKVAEFFGKQHKNVIRDIESLQVPEELHKLNFEPMLYDAQVGNGAIRKNKAYTITRDGFTILAMGFTGAKAMQFKVAYIQAFNEMEKRLAGAMPGAVLNDLQSQICTLTRSVQELAEYVHCRHAPRPADVNEYCVYRGFPEIGHKFCEWYDAHDWCTAKGEPIQNWRVAVQAWVERSGGATNGATAKTTEPEPEKNPKPAKPKLSATVRKRAKYDGWNLFTMPQLRKAARILVAEARGANAPAHKFCRQALVEFLSIREVTPSKVKNALLTANR